MYEELRNLKKEVKSLKKLLPESIIEYTKRMNRGEDVDFEKVVLEIEEREDQEMVEDVKKRLLTKVQPKKAFENEKEEEVSYLRQVQKQQDPEGYRQKLIDSGR